MQATELWTGISQSSLCPLILHVFKRSDTITMILSCEQKMAKPTLCSLDVADQQCRHLQSTGMSEDLHSQVIFGLLLPFQLEFHLWVNAAMFHGLYCFTPIPAIAFFVVVSVAFQSCQQQFWLVWGKGTNVCLAPSEANCNKMFFSTALLKDSSYCPKQERLGCQRTQPHICDCFSPSCLNTVFTES